MKGRLIALLTDFGTGDPYLAAMKGVIHSILPGAVIVDVSHGIPRHDAVSAAYALLSVEPYFPSGTVFTCVVDPGVGTKRRIILLEHGTMAYLAPDNGLLNFVAAGDPSERWHALETPRRGRGVSGTFHGRDVFAPAAARLAGGTPPGKLARRIPPLRPAALFTSLAGSTPSLAKGTILHIDHFGNIVTNIRMPGGRGRKLSLSVAGRTIRRVCDTYEDGPAGMPFLIRGSTGLVEISVRRGDAARSLRVRTGDGVVLKG